MNNKHRFQLIKINILRFLLVSIFSLFFVPSIIYAQKNESTSEKTEGENLLNSNYYGFEKAGEGWKTDNTKNWKYDTSKPATGNYSLKFSSLTEVNPLISFDTNKTILKVRTAQSNKDTYIIASSYEGTILGIRFDGKILWENPLSGFMNHDIWCADITGNGVDEILVANANGTTYCLNSKGETIWEFKANNGGQLPPMYAVCVVHDKSKTPYVVCGGFDMSIYYLSSTGELVKEVKSSEYSTIKPWGDNAPPSFVHNANFLRPLPQPDGSEVLVMLATNNQMQSTGALYQFKPLENTPFSTIDKVSAPTVIGDFHVVDPDGDKNYEILLGTSGINQDGMVRVDPITNSMETYKLSKIGSSGYRVTQNVTISNGDSFQYFMISGNYIVLIDPDLDPLSIEKFYGKYAYNDIWKSPTGHIILASSQSGGSGIHIINPNEPDWKDAFKNLTPPGKIEKILTNFSSVKNSLNSFTKPVWERDAIPVYLTWAKRSTSLAQSIYQNYDNPIFLDGKNEDKELWDVVHDAIPSPIYSKKKDTRQKYTLTQQQVLDAFLPRYENAPGIAYWVGHGNDPYMYSLETTKKVLDGANGKKTVMILPELGHTSGEGAFVLDDLIYPLATHASNTNATFYIRSKNIFWQGDIYEPAWQEGISGKHSKSIVPSMEETTDKTQELSLAGRIGLWASGAFDSWGMRCSRDNPSFDRSRQHSYQRLPNHFLRTMVYSLANGSQYLNNTYVDEEHMGLAWELVAKGALFVPKREEILSFSPVHLSMKTPDEQYIKEGTNVKWTTFYDREFEENNPLVFSRMNGTWPGAPVNKWDFSNYAANVKDRRQNFIPSYNNGMVLITPPQDGVFADPDATRGKLKDLLHPIYKDIMKEYITDGRNYYSADGNQTYAADSYYTTVENDIKDMSELLPITVSGDVAWVVAQTSPTHLRLTIIDNGYLNPNDRTAFVSFNNITPVKIVDVLDGTIYGTSGTMANIDIPCGMFRFIDIELTNPL